MLSLYCNQKSSIMKFLNLLGKIVVGVVISAIVVMMYMIVADVLTNGSNLL